MDDQALKSVQWHCRCFLKWQSLDSTLTTHRCSLKSLIRNRYKCYLFPCCVDSNHECTAKVAPVWLGTGTTGNWYHYACNEACSCSAAGMLCLEPPCTQWTHHSRRFPLKVQHLHLHQHHVRPHLSFEITCSLIEITIQVYATGLQCRCHSIASRRFHDFERTNKALMCCLLNIWISAFSDRPDDAM